MDRVYIARVYTPGEYCFSRYDKESVFDSYEAASLYLQAQLQDDGEPKTSLLCQGIQSNGMPSLGEIVSYALNDAEAWTQDQRWVFGENGELLHSPAATQPESDKTVTASREDAAARRVGDIVLVRGKPWNPVSHFDVDHIGVISWAPMPLTDWMAKGKSEDEWEGEYVVEFINSFGYLDHDHVAEQGIQSYRKPVPEALSFLTTLSDHYRGKRQIKEDVLKELYKSEVFVRKVKLFDESCFA